MLSVVNKVSVGEIDDASLSWRKLKNTGQAYATLTGLSLEEYQTYTVMVRGVNKAGLHSQTVTQNVTVETSPPVCIGKLSKLLKKVWNITFALNFCTYFFIIFTWVLHILKDCSFPYILQKTT